MDQRLLSIYVGAEVIRVVDATRKSATNIVINSVDEVSTPAGSFDDGYITDVLEIASAIRGKIIGKSSKAKEENRFRFIGKLQRVFPHVHDGRFHFCI